MDALKTVVCDAIDKATPDLKAISKEIFDHPELGFQEVHAHKCLTDLLEKYGFSVERSYKLDTAFRATYGSTETGGPNIAVLCEYDALPGLGHACGHNLIAEVGVAAGIGAKAALEAAGKPIGKVTVLGTPAEEGGGGKIDLIRAGAFKNIDAAMMAHPASWHYTLSKYLAMVDVNVIFRGKASHAASFPWEGLNALDAAVLCYQNVSCMRQQMKPAWRVHGVIKDGGEKSSIIPEETRLEYGLRTPTGTELDILRKRFESCVEAAAVATGCTFQCEFDDKPYLHLIGNQTLASLYEANASTFGIEFERDSELAKQLDGSTDMGNVTHMVPGIHPSFYIGDANSHSKDFAVCAATEDAQLHTLNIGKTVGMTVVDLFLEARARGCHEGAAQVRSSQGLRNTIIVMNKECHYMLISLLSFSLVE